MIKMIAAMDEGHGIGYENRLLYSCKKDMQHFRDLTLYKVVVMGYNTMLSLPKQHLESRVNFVVGDRRLEDDFPHCFFRSITEILLLSKYMDIWVIGGEKTYRQFLPYTDEIYLTVFEGNKKADTLFPEFESDFHCTELEPFQCESTKGEFQTYVRKQEYK